jgi:hypothetical protein
LVPVASKQFPKVTHLIVTVQFDNSIHFSSAETPLQDVTIAAANPCLYWSRL